VQTCLSYATRQVHNVEQQQNYCCVLRCSTSMPLQHAETNTSSAQSLRATHVSVHECVLELLLLLKCQARYMAQTQTLS
jgi:hypothetical protein